MVYEPTINLDTNIIGFSDFLLLIRGCRLEVNVFALHVLILSKLCIIFERPDIVNNFFMFELGLKIINRTSHRIRFLNSMS